MSIMDNDSQSEYASVSEAPLPARTPAPTAKQVLANLYSKMQAQQILSLWKAIRFDCRKIDKSRIGLINARQYREILVKHGFHVTEDEFFAMLKVFGSSRGSAIDAKLKYDAFMRDCLA